MSNKLPDYQTTLRDRIDLSGIGVHSGRPVSISLLPADPNTGVVFQRVDPAFDTIFDIQANVASVGATDLCTVLGDPRGVHVATVEHLMAALLALNVDNVYVEIDDSEVPVMDGSSEVFVDAIDQAGISRQAVRRRSIQILKTVRRELGGSWGEFTPYDGSRFEIEIDYDAPAIGRQKFEGDLTPDLFRRELSRARTFGFMKDVERLWAAGFALGSSLENSVVIGDDNRIINPEGLRYADEFVRHKALDTIGDLALAGAPIMGCYRSYRGGHKLNAMVLSALLSDEQAFDTIETSVTRERTVRAGINVVGSPALASDVS